jgi:hypothetical protein
MSPHPFTTPSVVYLGQGHPGVGAGAISVPPPALSSVSVPGR